jgi:hypothetical protein
VFAVQVQPSNNAKINSTYTMPIYSNISFPSVFKDRLGNSIGVSGENIQNFTLLPITVIQPLPPTQISIPPEFWTPIYGLIQGFFIPSIVNMTS